MKKIIAMLLAALMLLSVAALAETQETQEEPAVNEVAVMAISNVEVNMGGQKVALGEQTIFGLTLDATEEPTLVFSAENDEDMLSGIAVRLVNGMVQVTLSGDEAVYEGDPAKMNRVSAQTAQALKKLPEQLKQGVPELDSLVLPAFQGVSIPRLDTRGLLSSFVTGEENGATTFAISAEVFQSLLDMVGMYAPLLASRVPGADQIPALLNQMKEANIGLQVDGTIADEGDAQVTTLNLYLLQNGEVEEQPSVTLTFTSAENDSRLGVTLPGMGDVADIHLNSDPATPALDFDLDVGGMAQMNVRLYPQDGLQLVNMNANARGESVSLVLGYGESEGMDIFSVAANAQGTTLTLGFSTAMDAEGGVRSGNVELDVDNGDSEPVVITGDVYMWLDQEAPVTVDWSGEVRPIEELTQEKLEATLQPLVDYLGTLQPAA